MRSDQRCAESTVGDLDQFQRANLIWDEANLREYIKDPQARVKGNRMPFGGLSSSDEIDDVIAYLKTL
jgi:cytochrome c